MTAEESADHRSGKLPFTDVLPGGAMMQMLR